MRILFVSSYFPENVSKSVHGVFKRMRMFLDAIKEIAEIDLLLYCPEDKYRTYTPQKIEQEFIKYWQMEVNIFLCPKAEFREDTEIQKWLSLARGVFSFYKQKDRIEYTGAPQIAALEKCLERKPDTVFAHRLSAMCPLLLLKRKLPPIIFDMDDIEHVVLERYIKNRSSLRSKLLPLLIPSLIKGEYEAVKLASKTFVCSEQDRNYLTNKFKLPGVVTVPNAVSVPKLKPLTTKPNLLFLGSDYGPNVQAAQFLINEIWPRIKERVTEAKLVIAGISKEKLKSKSENIPGLELTGFVEDLDKLYTDTRATIVPMLVGGGTRFKIIEAAMYGRPTVSTSLGAEGIDLADSEEILIRDTSVTIAEGCVELLEDIGLCEKIGLSARKKAIECYNLENILSTIKTNIQNP